ncbi:hypothetical protein [Companilactobacillus kedongensis]|uniref:hypothetical protein n=1 Tax=Companilactobacillus kedongensis TaxID=2486004 RepID=UPI0013DDBBEE|nr:hypothetical protein [Companilactobacillus kedongensis]
MMKKKVWGIVMVLLLMLVTTACSSSETTSSTPTGPDPAVIKKNKEAKKALNKFKECSSRTGDFSIRGVGGFTRAKATLMYNESEKSYKFFLRINQSVPAAATFYLARVNIPDAKTYIYAFVVIKADGQFYGTIKNSQWIMSVGDGFDQGGFSLSDIEDNFDMSDSKEFTIYA